MPWRESEAPSFDKTPTAQCSHRHDANMYKVGLFSTMVPHSLPTTQQCRRLPFLMSSTTSVSRARSAFPQASSLTDISLPAPMAPLSSTYAVLSVVLFSFASLSVVNPCELTGLRYTITNVLTNLFSDWKGDHLRRRGYSQGH